MQAGSELSYGLGLGIAIVACDFKIEETIFEHDTPADVVDDEWNTCF